MLARKLDVQRAVALFEQHELIRKEEDLDNIDPLSDPLLTELNTGKFTILVSNRKKQKKNFIIKYFSIKKKLVFCFCVSLISLVVMQVVQLLHYSPLIYTIQKK